MRGEEKPYDMQAPCNDSELAKAIENDREIEDTLASSVLASPPVFELPTLRQTNAATAAISSASTSIVPNNNVSSVITSGTKSFNLTLPDSPIVSFPSICSILNGDEMDVKDNINDPTNGINNPLNLKPSLGKNIPPSITLPTTPLPMSSTTTISLPTQPINLYNAKLQTPSPKVFPSISNHQTTPLFFAVDINGDAKGNVQKTREISKSYAPFETHASLPTSTLLNNQLGCSISVGSVDSSTLSVSPCPSSSGSSSSPHSYSSQSINGPITTPDLGLSGPDSISISPAALHLSSSLISSHLPHSLDSLLTPAASPEDDSLEPWIQTV